MKVDRRHRKQNRKKNRIAKTLEKTDHKIEATSLLLSRLTERKKQFLERKTVLHIRSKRPGTDPYKRIDRILETWNVLFKETILVLQMQMCFRLDLGGFMEL